MFALTALIAAVDQDHAAFRGVTRRLMATWRDPHADRFEREVLGVLDQNAVVVLNALRDAESAVLQADRVLRGIGESLTT